MKKWSLIVTMGVAAAFGASLLLAQPEEGQDGPRGKRADKKAKGDGADIQGERPMGPPPGRGPGRGMMVGPLMAVLDADKDGELSAAEIANASQALKKLDKNGDGKVDRKELMAWRPEGAASRPAGGEKAQGRNTRRDAGNRQGAARGQDGPPRDRDGDAPEGGKDGGRPMRPPMPRDRDADGPPPPPPGDGGPDGPPPPPEE